MDTKDKLSRELLREVRKDPEFRKISDQQELAKDVGAEIARIRKKKRMSEQELAEKIGRTSKVIRRMEKGEFKQYTLKMLIQIAQATNTRLQFEFAD
jgi:ribosome-binding protein aMBF1 (putative translation factor)